MYLNQIRKKVTLLIKFNHVGIYSLENLQLWTMIVLIKMADYELILGTYIRFAFAFSSTFVTSPSYISIFSFAIETINKAF